MRPAPRRPALRAMAVAFLLAAGLAVLLGRPASAADPGAAGAPPVVITVTPIVVRADGNPIKVTLSGSGLSTVDVVQVSPALRGVGFSVFNDSTLLVVLPRTTPPGSYAIRALSPLGGSDGGAGTIQVVPAPPPPPPVAASTPAPQAAPTAAPTAAATAPPSPRAAAPHVSSRTAPPAAASGIRADDPEVTVGVGLFAGALIYLLWGAPGRIPIARRRDLAAQIVARPGQRLRVARICMHCGRLHWVLRTPRELWRGGEFCSATCCVAEDERSAQVARSTTAATARMREIALFPELDRQLERVFAAEAARSGRAASLFSPEPEAAATARAAASAAEPSRPPAAATPDPVAAPLEPPSSIAEPVPSIAGPPPSIAEPPPPIAGPPSIAALSARPAGPRVEPALATTVGGAPPDAAERVEAEPPERVEGEQAEPPDTAAEVLAAASLADAAWIFKLAERPRPRPVVLDERPGGSPLTEVASRG